MPEAAPPRKKFCQFGGKVAYSSLRAAKEARRSLEYHGNSVQDLRIYTCPNCFMYHLTSRPD